MAYPMIADAARTAEAWLHSLDAEQVLQFGGYAAGTAAALFAGRTLCVAITRATGLYHPNHYSRYPRLVPWRAVYKSWMTLQAWRERVFRMGQISSGGFCGALASMTFLYSPDKIFLGRAYAFGMALLQPLGVKVKRHLFMVAMTGGGKTTLLQTLLHCWQGSALVIDPKGQITQALARKDKKRRWFVFDLYGISGQANTSINVFDVLKEAVARSGQSAAVLWAQRIAQCLISTPDGSRTPYFYDISRGFVVGLMLHVLTTHPEKDHNLPFIRTLIVQGYRVFDAESGAEETKGDEAFRLLLKSMQQNPAYDGAVVGAATALENAGTETLGNVLSTLQEQTKWLDVPPIRQALLTSTLSLADLKRLDDVVLVLVAGVFSIREELKDLFRLIINMAAYVFEAVKEKKGQCLFVVDELPNLGYNPTFEVLPPVARSQGITFVGITQDIDMLKKSYPKSWQTFIGNADCVYWMGTNNQDTLNYLSGVLGKTTKVEKDRNTGRKSYRQVTVAEPDQLGRFLNPDAARMIVTRASGRAIKAVNDPHYRALPVWAYDPDPEHPEAWLRRLMRFILCRRPKPISHEKSRGGE